VLSIAAAGTDYVTGASTNTFTNKTFDANGTGNALSNVETADVASSSKTGADAKLATGTAGTSGNLAMWNVDGDLVDGSVAAAGLNLKRAANVIFFDDSQSFATGDGSGDIWYTFPFSGNFDLTKVILTSQTAGTTGTMDVQVRNVTQAADMLSTKATLDSGEKTSLTAAAPPVIDTGNDDVAEGDEIRIDVDACQTTPALGGQMALIFTPV